MSLVPEALEDSSAADALATAFADGVATAGAAALPLRLEFRLLIPCAKAAHGTQSEKATIQKNEE